MNRKIMSASIAFALLLAVAGCGKYSDEGKKNESASGSNSSSSSSSSNSSSNNTTGNSAASNNTSTTNTNTNNNTSTNNQSNQETKPAEKANLTGLKPGDTAKVGPISVTLKQTQVVATAANLPPGYVHLMTELLVVNDGADNYTINITDHFKLETPEGKKAPYNVTATANKSPRLQGSLLQGKNATGWIGYLSKKVAGNYKYMYIHPDYGQATWEFAIQ